MRTIFFTYWSWYIITLVMLISDVSMPLGVAKMIGVSTFLNFAYVAFAPIYYLIYSDKSHRSDQKYLNACLYSGVIRTVIWCFAFYGLKDHSYILAINGLGMFVFILMERKLRKIDSSYFNV